MKRFRNIILSSTEPMHEDLWFRPTPNSLDPTKSDGFGIWWYSSSGWKCLTDSDTKYNLSSAFLTNGSEDTISSESVTDATNGIVTTTLTYYVYDGSRDLGDYSNIVLESGLKTQVEALTALIEAEASARSTADTSLQEQIHSNDDDISSLQSDLSSLSSSFESLITWINI